MIRHDEAMEQLSGHEPASHDEAASLRHTLDFLQTAASPYDRSAYAPGHVTVSAFTVTASEQVALIYHAKLQRWLQPGGHLEASDRSLRHAVLRELEEETGVAAPIDLVTFFDVDVHAIPQRGPVPQHLHFDLRYLIRVPDTFLVAGSDAEKAAWRSLDEIISSNEYGNDIKRMAIKSGRRR